LTKKAFTLFELMVVVMIIGIVYSLVLGTFNPKNSIKIANLKNIKQGLLPHWKKGHKVEFYVYDKCSKSIVYINGEPKENIKPDIQNSLFDKIKVYKKDRYGDKTELEFTPVKLENKIYKSCFKYTIFPNGSSSSYIIYSNKKYYILYPYFKDTQISTSIDDAFELYQQKQHTKITASE
jgi:prepilin-type N-terminal cleavage/methylation domain-containing protein